MAGVNAPRRRASARHGELDALGQVASERRFQLGLTQAEVADLAGVGVTSVRALEAGQSTLSLGLSLNILGALGLVLAVADLPTLRADPAIVVIALAKT